MEKITWDSAQSEERGKTYSRKSQQLYEKTGKKQPWEGTVSQEEGTRRYRSVKKVNNKVSVEKCKCKGDGTADLEGTQWWWVTV